MPEKFRELTNNQLNEAQFDVPHKQIQEDFDAEVVKVHDADTITLKTNFRNFNFPLRFLEIDAPELNEGGEQARQFLRSQILGRMVQIRVNIHNRVDKFGRLLGRVVYKGLDMGDTMMRLGYVKPFGSRNEGKFPKTDKTFSIKQWF